MASRPDNSDQPKGVSLGGRAGFSDADLDFVVDLAAPGAQDKDQLKQLLRNDEAFREALVSDEGVFQQVVNDQEILLKISPALYFEVLLRRALKDLETSTHTMERTGRQNIPVFDVDEVVDLMSRSDIIDYLSKMLASFIRIHGYVTSVRVRRGIRRRVRHNDMDVDSLVRLCADADEPRRYRLYKRIADVCLFVSGVFPEHTSMDYRYASTGDPRLTSTLGARRSLEDYERDGRRFYGLAQEHPAARALELTDVFGLLKEHFNSARKPLTFIATQYLHSSGHHLFGAPAT